MFALWCFAKHNCISSIGMVIYRTRKSAAVKPRCVSRFINFNIAKHPTPLPDHNSPNSTCSSNITVNLQLYACMRMYPFENPQPLLHVRKAWSEERVDLHPCRQGKRGGVSLHLSKALFVYSQGAESFAFRPVFVPPFISPPFMCSIVDSYQGQDKEIEGFFSFFFLLTDNIFSAQSLSHPFYSVWRGCNLIQRNALLLYKGNNGKHVFPNTADITFWHSNTLFAFI